MPRFAATTQVIQAINQFGQPIEYRIIAAPAQPETLIRAQPQQTFQQVQFKESTEQQTSGQQQVILSNLVGGQE